ncbi:MAG: precorrin-2 C(20)-methyltransferase [Cyanobacteria bacterium]|nr:precorrin-2 C(20)-methyltransferase [Cyanobacteriota bacterium]
MTTSLGKLYGIGLGPGDPELLTLKAYRILRSVPIVVYPMSPDGRCISRSIVAEYLQPHQIEMPMVLPFKPGESSQPGYQLMADKMAIHLAQGQDIAVLCEGDPFFFGTFMYLYNRLNDRFPTEMIPGVSSVMASANMLGAPLTYRNDVFMALSGTLDAEILRSRLLMADAAVLMKLGRNFVKVYGVLESLNLLDRALYIERATMKEQRIIPIREVDSTQVPYFAMIVIPSEWKWQDG